MTDPYVLSLDGRASLALLPGLVAILSAGFINPGALPTRAWKAASIGAYLMLAAAVEIHEPC